MNATPLTRLTRTAVRLAAGLLVASGLAAGLGARPAAADTTTTHAVAVECTSFGPTGQVCSPSFVVPVKTTGAVRLRFTASPNHCSDIRIRTSYDIVPGPFTDFLKPGESVEVTLGPLGAGAQGDGSHRVGIAAEGRTGGCNTGRLTAWSGSLQVTIVDGGAGQGQDPKPSPDMVMPTLRIWDHGAYVTTLQNLLRQHGATIVADGIFGPKTLDAVKAFQAQQGLVVDGIVGPKTWAALQAGQGQVPAAGLYTLRNGARSDMLDSTPDQKVFLKAPNGGASQKWMLETAPDGHVFLRNLATGAYLDINPNEPIWDVYTQAKNGGASQQWKVEPGTDGRFMLRNRATSRVLARPLAYSVGNPDGVWTTALAAGAQGVSNLQWTLASTQP